MLKSSISASSKESLIIILDQIYLEWPELKEWDTKMLVALDLNYVDTATEVVEGQTLALMPPFALLNPIQ